MKKIKFFLSFLVILTVQMSCYAPRRSLPQTTPLPVEVKAPSLTLRGEKYQFIIQTSPLVTCHTGVAFWDTSNNWVFEEFPTIQANSLGVCEWNWEVPVQALDGAAAFRGFVENENESTDLMPVTFCIEVEDCE
ncbi:hypothetical protein [Candidatus Villigracilis saccharophilus]|uniref:hypothetical protein n=1 Tax=Candidatus Villigracilis saccharophilus TaxID=3140684 RepID=UPI0031368418|nr:hypothetical protein [Anaerolineales bacterium]